MCDQPPEGARAHPSKTWWRTALYLGLTAVVLYFVGRYLVGNLRDFGWNAVRMDPGFLTVAVLSMAAQHLLAAFNYSQILTAFGCSIGRGRVLAIYCTATLGKYVPGKVATFAGSVMLLRRFQVPLPVALATPFLASGIAILTGLIASTPLLLMEGVREHFAAESVVAGAMMLAGLVSLHPRVFIPIANVVLRRFKREPMQPVTSARQLLAAVAVSLGRYALLGVSLWATARSMTNAASEDLLAFTATASSAAVLGVLAFFSPAGLGVREGVYVFVLGPMIGPEMASLVAIVARIVQTGVELAAGAAGIIFVKWQAHRMAAARGTPLRELENDA